MESVNAGLVKCACALVRALGALGTLASIHAMAAGCACLDGPNLRLTYTAGYSPLRTDCRQYDGEPSCAAWPRSLTIAPRHSHRGTLIEALSSTSSQGC